MKRLSSKREAAAEDYAWSIEQKINRDWSAYNATLIDEFGLAGLKQIKERAWTLITERNRVRR